MYSIISSEITSNNLAIVLGIDQPLRRRLGPRGPLLLLRVCVCVCVCVWRGTVGSSSASTCSSSSAPLRTSSLLRDSFWVGPGPAFEVCFAVSYLTLRHCGCCAARILSKKVLVCFWQHMFVVETIVGEIVIKFPTCVNNKFLTKNIWLKLMKTLP